MRGVAPPTSTIGSRRRGSQLRRLPAFEPLANPQRVQPRLEADPIDCLRQLYVRSEKLIRSSG
jgi:hypothetical protein